MGLACAKSCRAAARFLALLFSTAFIFGTTQAADHDDTQTSVTGTDSDDTLDLTDSQDASASVTSAEGGKQTATATGVDAKDGVDTIGGNAMFNTIASATANLAVLPDPTEATATAKAISAGDGNDQITSSFVTTSTANALGIYAGSLEYVPLDPSIPPPKEINTSITTSATASGVEADDGDDRVVNDGLFTISAFATSGGTADQFNATVRESVSLKTTSTSKATANGIDTGDGADTAQNNGVMLNSAMASSAALAIGLVAPKSTPAPDPQSPTPPKPKKTQIKSDSTATATATVTGINTESDDTEDSSEDASPYGLDGLKVTYHKTVSTVSGDDTVENGVALTNLATATSGAGSGAISNKVDGTVDASASAEATAESTGVTTGGGNDQVTNHGELLSKATATGAALSVSIEVGAPSEPAPTPAPAPGEKPKAPKPSEDKDNKASSKTSVTAKATASGIDTEGSGTTEVMDRTAQIEDGKLVLDETKTTGNLAGNDTVTNLGAIQAIASATSAASNASITQSIGGSASLESKSKATSTATGITTGGGNDEVTNDGLLTIEATSDASGLTAALAVGKAQETTPAPDPDKPPTTTSVSKLATSSENNVEAEATASGIDAEDTGVTTTATRNLSIGLDGLTLSWGESKTGSAGNDTIVNNGLFTTKSKATSSALDGSVTLDAAGSVKADATSSAKATSSGVYTGAGADTITNNVLLTVSAEASASSISLGLSASKPPVPPAGGASSEEKPDKTNIKVKAGATAEADAKGVDAEGTQHNQSKNTSVNIGGNGLVVVNTRNDSSQAAADTVTNNGALTVRADADTGVFAGGVIIGAAGSVDADAKSSSKATSGAISTGGGADTIENSGILLSEAEATAHSLSISANISQQTDATGKKPDSKEALKDVFATSNSVISAESEARSTAIDAEGQSHAVTATDRYEITGEGLFAQYNSETTSLAGDDVVTNSVLLTSKATALSGAGSVAASLGSEGSTSSEAAANARAASFGVLTGGGSDTVTNTGAMSSTAEATAGALNFSLVVGAPSASPTPSPPSAPAPAAVPKKPATPTKDKESKTASKSSVAAAAEAIGIDAEGSAQTKLDESIRRLSLDGLQISGTSSVNSAGGADTVTNEGALLVTGTASASSREASIDISTGGSTQAESKASATAKTAGIATGGGSDQITNNGLLTSNATSNASAVTLGLAIGLPQETTPPVEGGTPAAATVSKLTSRTDTSVTSRASSMGIDAEGKGTQTSSNYSLQLDLEGLHFSFDDRETSSAGDDVVLNGGGITANSSATADSTDASVVLDAVGSVKSEAKSTASAATTGIYTGAGNDRIVNGFLLDADATASADALSLALTASKPPEKSSSSAPAPGAKKDKTNVVVNAAASADATANGIDAEGAHHDLQFGESLVIDGNQQLVTITGSDTVAAGDDVVENHGLVDIDATSTSGTVAVGIAITASGSVDSDAKSKATATTGAILTGGGDDHVTNTVALTSDADSTATALSVAVSVSQPTDGTGTKPSTLDGLKDVFATAHSLADAEAESRAVGIDAGGDAANRSYTATLGLGGDGSLAKFHSEVATQDGKDLVDNSGAIIVSAGALTAAGAVEVKVQSEGTASSEANANSKSTTGGVLTGAGDDTVNNSGALTATSTATAGAVAISFSQSSAQGSKARSDARATSDARSVGIGTGAAEADGYVDAKLGLKIEGIEVTYKAETHADHGADTINNTGIVAATSIANSGAAGAAVAIDGSASSDVTANAKARADAVDAGGGGDLIDNGGALTALATATSGSLSLGFGQKGDDKSGGKNKVESNSISEATATGISADSGTDSLIDASLLISLDGLAADAEYDSGAAIGNDQVVNRGGIGATAIATSGAGGVVVAIDGSAKSDIDSIAKSRASGIDAGGGADQVLNLGAVVSTATSTAAGVGLTLGKKGTGSAPAKVNVSTNTEAVGIGIATDGGGRTDHVDAELDLLVSGLHFEVESHSGAVTGDDVLDNRGAVASSATATSTAESVAVSIGGAANAAANSQASADSIALDTGGGADQVRNSSALGANAFATASTLNAAVSSEGRAISNAGFMGAGTTAKSRALGISTAGIEETLRFEIVEDISFSDISASFRLEIENDSITADGADHVENSGDITLFSNALAPRADVSISGKGIAVSMGRASSEAYGAGIDSGNLGDYIDNSGAISSTVNSTATLASVAVTGKGLAVAANAVWDGGTEATAESAGINADGGSQTTMVITAEVNSDLARVRHNKDVVAASGNDEVHNRGNITSRAFAEAPSVSISVSGGLGLAAAVSTSTANSTSSAIRGGDGNDLLTNTGVLTVGADAKATTANAAVTNSGMTVVADSVLDGGTKANATATGIAGDGGDRSRGSYIAVGTDETTKSETQVLADGADDIKNGGDMDVLATSRALSLGVAVTNSGVSAATATSTSTARAAAIDAGAGASVDRVENAGNIGATAHATAAAASITVTNAGVAVSADSVWDGGTTADARGRGIEVGSGADTIINVGDASAKANSDAYSTTAAVAVVGVAGGIAKATSLADAVALDAGASDEDDVVENSGHLLADADATAASVAIAFTTAGVAGAGGSAWDGGTRAYANAAGIALGGGADQAKNFDYIESHADAISTGLAVSVAVEGVAGAITAANSEARSAGIDGAAGEDTITNRADILATSYSNANTISAAATKFGVSVAGNNSWDGGATSKANSAAISGGNDKDSIDSSGTLTANAWAVSPSVAVSFTVAGVSGALSASNSTADAHVIDGGDADDAITNTGALNARSDSDATAVSVAISGAGGSVAGGSLWDGGTTSNANASGIRGGLGADQISNSTAAATINAEADALSTSVAYSVSGAGLAGSITTSTANANATAIDAGDGNDKLFNDAGVRGKASSNAVSASIAIVATGVAVASDAFWDGGTKANATASGVSGGIGADEIVNHGAVTADSDSHTTSASVAASVSPSFGMSFAAAASKSTSLATSIDGGSGDDLVTNTGPLLAKSDATAAGISISVAPVGGAVAGALDATTSADSTAIGMSGGDGVDVLVNAGDAAISLDTDASTLNLAFALTLGGVALANADASSVARGTAMDGGNAEDTLRNEGSIGGTLDSRAASASLSVSALGLNAATASASGQTFGAGLAGGDGNDRLENLGAVALTLNSNAAGLGLALAMGGVSIASAGADAYIGGDGLRGDAGADVLVNTGHVDLSANATTAAVSLAITQAGVAVASANAVAGTDTTGMRGGADNDVLGNSSTGVIEVHSKGVVTGAAQVGGQFGGTFSEARTLTHVLSTGLAGDAGDDGLINEGTIRVRGTSESQVTAGSVTVGGAGSARAGTEVATTAIGISAGSGKDNVTNTGTIFVGPEAEGQWMSKLATGALSIGFSGTTDAQSDAFARTNSTGIDGGTDDDVISNSGVLSVTANAYSVMGSGAMQIFGSSAGGGTSGAFTHALGIDGSDGNDRLESLTQLEVTAQSLLTQTAKNFTFGGSGEASGKLVAGTEACGLTGGSGNDAIAAAGTFKVTATSTMNSDGGGTTIFGGSSVSATTGATTYAQGIDGDSGADVIDSEADLTLAATSALTMSSSSYALAGSGDTSGRLTALARVDGILGGEGNDSIGSSGNIRIDAQSTLSSSGNSEATFGSASDFVSSGGTTQAVALAGGAGDDVIENRNGGSINLAAKTRVSTTSAAYTFLGSGPSTGAALTGESMVTGISGDDGNDQLINRGTIDIRADAALVSKGGAKVDVTATSGSASTGTATVEARALGFDGGQGDDRIDSVGTVSVIAIGLAEANNDAAGGGFSIVNGNEAGAVTRADVLAVGIDGGAGANRAQLAGDITVEARGTAYSLALSSGATVSLSSGSGSRVDSVASATATGVRGEDADDVVLQTATLTVTANATTAKKPEITITVRRDKRSSDPTAELEPPPEITASELPTIEDSENNPYTEGTIVFWTESDPQYRDNPEGTFGGYYEVVSVLVEPDEEGEEPHEELQWVYLPDGVFIDETIGVPYDSFPSYAAANGSGLDGTGNATATGSATAQARGLTLGAGNNRIESRGDITVTATAEAALHTSADGDAWGDANATSSAITNALAIGVELGDGNDDVAILGQLHVTAIPIAQARGEASGGDICIWFFGWWCGGGGDGYTFTEAGITGSATGILAGGGDNRIEIGGDLTVISRPGIRVDERTGEFVAANYGDGDAAPDGATSLTSRALGILTGDGNDEVINTGSITVEALDLLSACQDGACEGANVAGAIVQARGILTGGGDDIVRNDGTMVVSTVINGVRQLGVGIDTGSGNDQLFLGDGSQITGTVSLGEGDDVLDLRGTPKVGDLAGNLLNVDAGAGTDTLLVNGAGSYAGTPLSIERAGKYEAGTYTLPSLVSVEELVIDAGTLHVASDYSFDEAGSFATYFHADGDHGQLALDGAAALDGALAVEKRGDTFIADGTRYTIVAAQDGVSSEFADVALPESRPLLEFELELQPNTVDVVARAKSFAVVTDNPLYQQIADDLDTIARHPTGDLLQLFGTLQSMDQEFDRALASFSPESHLATSGATLINARQMTRVLQGHLGESRTRYQFAPHSTTPDASLMLSGGSGGLGFLQMNSTPFGFGAGADAPGAGSRGANRRDPHSQTWMLGVEADGEFDPVEGYGGFETDTSGYLLGVDRRLGDAWMVGANAGQTKTDVSQSFATGRVETWMGSLYATWFEDGYYFESGISYGGQKFKDARTLVVGPEERNTQSSHDGNALGAFAAGGVQFGNARWTIAPYGSLNYFSVSEDGFEETGGDGMSQSVRARTTHALFGEAGATFSYRLPVKRSVLDWHALLGAGYLFNDNARVTYSYAGAPDSVFAIDGRPASNTDVLYGLGVSLYGDRSAVSIDYHGRRSSDHEEELLTARFTLRF